MRSIDYLSGIAANTAPWTGDFGLLRTPSPFLHASVALFLLVVATTLSVYKPRGMTRYGLRKQFEQRMAFRIGRRSV